MKNEIMQQQDKAKNKEVARRLKSALEQSGMTWAELSKQTGISKSSLSAYKSGQYQPKQDKAYLIAKALNVDPSWLLAMETVLSVPIPKEPIVLSNEEAILVVGYRELSHEYKNIVMDIVASHRKK